MDVREQMRWEDPLFHQKVKKRRMNKEMKFCRKQIEDLAHKIGSYSQKLDDLISSSKELDAEIKQLQEKN